MDGVLFLVVGPSGAGKDTMIDAARACFAGNPRLRFVRRVITRAHDAGGEDHAAVSGREFARLSGAGAFCLQWRAHGLAYGIPVSIEDDLAGGKSVIVNVSRTVIAEAEEKYSNVAVLHVTAPREVLEERLKQRGREHGANLAERLERAGAYTVKAAHVHVIDTAGPLEENAARFCAAIAREAGL